MFLDPKKGNESTIQNILCSSSQRVMDSKKILFKDISLFPCNNGRNIPDSTDIACWYCTEKFKGRPKTIPIDFKNNTWIVRGVFCSWGCAKSYSIRRGCHTEEELMFMNIFARKVYGRTKPIKMSPPYESLKKFGGGLSIEEFRDQDDKYESIELLEQPFKSCKACIKIKTNQISQCDGFRVGQVIGLKRIQNSTDKQNSHIRTVHNNKNTTSMFKDFLKKK